MFSLANNLGIKFYLKNQSFKCIAYLSYHITAHHIHSHVEQVSHVEQHDYEVQ